MNFIWDKITEWLKGLLVSGIISNLSGLFDAINTRVGEAAAVVGTTPQAWNSSIFQMIRTLSENVVVPIAGIILTFVMCLCRLTEEVNQLRARVKEADRTAINATCELYALTPEMLSTFLRAKFGTQDNATEIPAAPQLPEGENE